MLWKITIENFNSISTITLSNYIRCKDQNEKILNINKVKKVCNSSYNFWDVLDLTPFLHGGYVPEITMQKKTYRKI